MTNPLEIRRSQRFSKRAANAISVNYGYVQTNSQKENPMNTHTNAMHPQKKAHRTIRNNLFHNTAIMTIILALVTAAAIAVYTANQPVVAENSPAVLYSNALEMQYAQPWLPETELTISVTGSKTPLDCYSSLETLYACKYGYGRP